LFTLSRFIQLVILCFVVSFSVNATAQEQSATQNFQLRVAILDMKGVLKNSTAVTSIQKQINGYRSGFQNEIQNEENQLRSARQELSRQRTVLSPEAYSEETKKFESRVAEVQRMVQLRRQELDVSRNKAMGEVQASLNKIIAEIASKKKLSLILRREQTVLSSRALEITEEVTAQLNSLLPDITVPKPGT
jgi:Skp family chaperone for outer membrane proteins